MQGGSTKMQGGSTKMQGGATKMVNDFWKAVYHPGVLGVRSRRDFSNFDPRPESGEAPV